MENIFITNIQILDKKELYTEIKEKTGISSITLYKYLKEKKFPEYIYYYLKLSEHISFDTLTYISEDEPDKIDSILENNNIKNALGLTNSEKWYNSLSEEHKNYIKELSSSVFSLIPQC